MAGLRDRLLRHPSDQKKRRWHIDHFLNDKQAGVKKISLYLAVEDRIVIKPIEGSTNLSIPYLFLEPTGQSSTQAPRQSGLCRKAFRSCHQP
jgi:hypothetical protein